MGIPNVRATTAAVRWAAAMPRRPVQAFERNRCRDDPVGREHAADRAAAIRHNEREIESPCLLDAAMQAGGTKAQGRCNATRVVLAHGDLCIEG